MFNSNNNGYSLSDIAAATGNGNNRNDGGFGFGEGGAWILILFIILLMGGWNGNGWGNNNGNGGGNVGAPGNIYITSDVQRGFDQAAVTSGINDIAANLCNGFSNVQQSLCNGFAGVNSNLSNGFAAVNGNMANGFAQAEIASNARQIADMQQNFAAQMATTQGMNTLQAQLAQCCCDNRSATNQLKYTVATEACADRAAVDGALRDVTAQGVANTQALMNTINGGIQSIKDQLCQDKIDAKNETIANLRQELAMKDLAASQTAQNSFIAQGFANEVDQLYNRLNSCPVPTTPVYGRTPIFTCNNSGWDNGCGCGGNAFYN